MPTVDITEANFEEKVLKSTTPVLVDFWAAWCAPCKMAEPVLADLSEVYKDKLIIAKMDVDANQTTPPEYGIMSIPTTVLFKGGKEMGRQIGFSGKEAYEDLIKKGI